MNNIPYLDQADQGPIYVARCGAASGDVRHRLVGNPALSAKGPGVSQPDCAPRRERSLLRVRDCRLSAVVRWRPSGGSLDAKMQVPGSSILDSLREIGQEPDRVLALAASDQMKATLQTETDTTRALGIFGAPTFVTGGELFWGDDRLSDVSRGIGGSPEDAGLKSNPLRTFAGAARAIRGVREMFSIIPKDNSSILKDNGSWLGLERAAEKCVYVLQNDGCRAEQFCRPTLTRFLESCDCRGAVASLSNSLGTA
jgi:hypothetical protein